jgi:hypothetical protein
MLIRHQGITKVHPLRETIPIRRLSEVTIHIPLPLAAIHLPAEVIHLQEVRLVEAHQEAQAGVLQEALQEVQAGVHPEEEGRNHLPQHLNNQHRL